MNCPHGVQPSLCFQCRKDAGGPDAIDVAKLRSILAPATDDQWLVFVNGYAYGMIAGELVEKLGADGRKGFFASLMNTYDLVTGERREGK